EIKEDLMLKPWHSVDDDIEDKFDTAKQTWLDDNVSQKSLLECVEEELSQRGHRSSLYLEDGLTSCE
ncbi:unnamed protein product, partial [Candidula unifasciata]